MKTYASVVVRVWGQKIGKNIYGTSPDDDEDRWWVPHKPCQCHVGWNRREGITWMPHGSDVKKVSFGIGNFGRP
jgi:hypothetical protein